MKIVYTVKISFTDDKGKDIEVQIYASSEQDLLKKVATVVNESKGKFLWLLNH